MGLKVLIFDVYNEPVSGGQFWPFYLCARLSATLEIEGLRNWSIEEKQV